MVLPTNRGAGRHIAGIYHPLPYPGRHIWPIPTRVPLSGVESVIPTRVPLSGVESVQYPPGCLSRVLKGVIYPPGCLSRCVQWEIYPPGCLPVCTRERYTHQGASLCARVRYTHQGAPPLCAQRCTYPPGCLPMCTTVYMPPSRVSQGGICLPLGYPKVGITSSLGSSGG